MCLIVLAGSAATSPEVTWLGIQITIDTLDTTAGLIINPDPAAMASIVLLQYPKGKGWIFSLNRLLEGLSLYVLISVCLLVCLLVPLLSALNKMSYAQLQATQHMYFFKIII